YREPFPDGPANGNTADPHAEIYPGADRSDGGGCIHRAHNPVDIHTDPGHPPYRSSQAWRSFRIRGRRTLALSQSVDMASRHGVAPLAGDPMDGVSLSTFAADLRAGRRTSEATVRAYLDRI